MLLFLYRLFIYLTLPFMLLRLRWKARQQPAYAQRWRERLAYALPPPLPRTDWVHAVSVGEFLAIKPLLERWLEMHPERNLWLTCTTVTASAQIQAWQSQHPQRLRHSYWPYDCGTVLKRFLRHVRPENIILMETEIWPNLILEGAKTAPILLENARLSARSCRRYRPLRPLLRRLWPHLLIHAQDRASRKRFQYLGATRLALSPSLKYHPLTPAPLQPPLKRPAAWTLLAASTHPGEEALLLQAFRIFKEKHPDAQLWLAPRHPERRNEVMALIERSGWQATQRSRGEAPAEVFLIDTLGELRALYGLANAAFIGGSLVPRGGHHPLEALHAGIPLCFGRHMFHFQSMRDALIKHDFAVEIETADAKHIAAAWEKLKGGDWRREIAAFVAPHHRVLEQHLTLWQKHLKS